MRIERGRNNEALRGRSRGRRLRFSGRNVRGENGQAFSRGEEKISGAAKALGIDFRGKTVLDIGSSTGGFTEYALAAGAARVIAVEKGSRQMRAPLRFDSRVELHEKTDIFEFRREMSGTLKGVDGGEARYPDIILIDVSFLSLTNVLRYARLELACRDTDLFAMLKPQFEVGAEYLEEWGKGELLNKGIVKNEKVRREIIRRFEEWVRGNGFVIIGKRDNVLAGKHGNVERFYRLRVEGRF
jgi:23S rRNA (cytidine1920-2'-O)/16S rRNA (cytidine1409-2'-O)-methyltransferase